MWTSPIFLAVSREPSPETMEFGTAKGVPKKNVLTGLCALSGMELFHQENEIA